MCGWVSCVWWHVCVGREGKLSSPPLPCLLFSNNRITWACVCDNLILPFVLGLFITETQEEEALDPAQYFQNRCKAMQQLEVRCRRL